MKRYFDEFDVYNEHANKVGCAIRNALLPIYNDEEFKGFSLRDLTHLVMDEALGIESEKVLRQGVKRRKEKRNG